jgi:PHD/YefM family antitoxin component YafN of YafNO toxin-antitoxin module
LTAANVRVYIIQMNSTVTISQLQAQAPRCVRRAEREGALSIARHGRTVAVMLSRERMEAIIESLEIMGNPNAMKAIRDYEAGKTKMKNVSCLD